MGQAAPPTRIALVVEDDHDVRDFASAVLEETDLQVVEAESAEEALAFLRKNAQDVALIFADIRLTCLMDGADLARTVNLKWPWIKLLVTSGNPGDRLTNLPRSASFMPKPWRVLDVLIEAERAVQRS